jgi:hypothetical protein
MQNYTIRQVFPGLHTGFSGTSQCFFQVITMFLKKHCALFPKTSKCFAGVIVMFFSFFGRFFSVSFRISKSSVSQKAGIDGF